MDRILSAPLFVITFVAGTLLMMELGRRVGLRRLKRDPNSGLKGMGSIEGAVFALFGLLIAFTFSGSASRIDSRRQLIAEEANDIGTAYLRLDLLPGNTAPLRALFRDYVDSRLAVYRKLPDIDAAKAELARSSELQNQIWTLAVTASHENGVSSDAPRLLLPAINSMIDITSTRVMAARIHPPTIIYVLLLLVGLGCAIMAGCEMAQSKYRSYIHMLGFTFIIGVSLYVTIGLEYPRIGYVHLPSYDQVLADQKDSMK